MGEDHERGERDPAAVEWGAASEYLYRRYFPRLVRFCRRRVADEAEAQDLAQDAMLRALLKIDRFDPTRPIWPWLRAVAANVIADRGRRRTWEIVGDLPDTADRRSELGRIEDRHLLKAALSGLTSRQRLALGLRYMEDRSAQEAGAHLGLSPLAFRQLLHRARVRLREELDRLGHEGLGLAWPALRGIREAWRRAWTRGRSPLGAPGGASESMSRLIPLLIALPLISAATTEAPRPAPAAADQRGGDFVPWPRGEDPVRSPGAARPRSATIPNASQAGAPVGRQYGSGGGGGGGRVNGMAGIDTPQSRIGDQGASSSPSPTAGHLAEAATGGVACSPTTCDNDLVSEGINVGGGAADDLASIGGP